MTRFQVVVYRVATAETAEHQEHAVPLHRIIVVVVMSAQDSLYVPHLFQGYEQTRIYMRGIGFFSEVAFHHAARVQPGGIVVFGQRDMEKCQ